MVSALSFLLSSVSEMPTSVSKRHAIQIAGTVDQKIDKTTHDTDMRPRDRNAMQGSLFPPMVGGELDFDKNYPPMGERLGG